MTQQHTTGSGPDGAEGVDATDAAQKFDLAPTRPDACPTGLRAEVSLLPGVVAVAAQPQPDGRVTVRISALSHLRHEVIGLAAAEAGYVFREPPGE